ncbi:MAG: DivIVA domain-containing protein [Evtepia sp.]
MMTPREAETHVFSKATFNGYNMSQVDTFLDELLSDYNALYKESSALKAKIKVLVEKLEEYRSTEDGMRKALLTAQKVADNILKEAEEKKQAAMDVAAREVSQRMSEIRQEIANEELRLGAAREATAIYVNQLKELYDRELNYMAGLSDLVAPTDGQPSQTTPIRETAQEIEKSVTQVLDDIVPPAYTPEPSYEQEAAPDLTYDDTSTYMPSYAQNDSPTVPDTVSSAGSDLSDTISFDHLQFGKDYEFQ